MTDKFKRPRGAPKLPFERVRVDISTKVDPATYRWLVKQPIALGRTIDKLVEDAMDKQDYDSRG